MGRILPYFAEAWAWIFGDFVNNLRFQTTSFILLYWTARGRLKTIAAAPAETHMERFYVSEKKRAA